MGEPDLSGQHRLRKLYETYKEHNTIIVGVDFDDTVFSLDGIFDTLCSGVRGALLEGKDNITICLYTVADTQSLKYKVEMMKLWGIPARYVNKSPVSIGDGSKPFFNLLLDDKAGLCESYRLLKDFNSLIKRYKV